MEKHPNSPDNNKLRKRALDFLEKHPSKKINVPAEKVEELMEELRVHQVELEMQNEELRRANLEVELTRDKYLDLYDFAPVGYLSISEKGMIMEANLTLAKMLQIERGVLINRVFSDFILKEDKDIFYLHRKNLIQNGVAEPCELRMVNKNEEVFFTQINCILLNDNSNNGLLIRSVVMDISERKRTDAILIKSELKYRSLIETASDGIYLLADDGTFVECNPSACKMLGREKNEIIGSLITEIDPNYSYEEFTDFWKEFPFDEQRIFETSHIHKDGSLIPIEISARKFKIESSIVYCAIARDITERKKSENAIRESQERFNFAMAATKDGIYDWDLITNEIYYSPGWKQMLGYKDHELKNEFSVWEKLTEPEDAKKSWDMLNAHISGKLHRFELEFKMKHKNGHWVDILSRAEAIFDSKGKAIRVVGTHVDITSRKKIEKELIAHRNHLEEMVNERTKELQEKNEVLEKFNNLFVGRESRIKELRDKIKLLEEKISK
ncbi:MAG: PAS domain S-box protein [Bacteroidales bacterium]|nr:PAS domain S-box protein [Bacteroidales bacterium]MCF8404231.1 PAS domain S-box protein [Bacteroidales bacterium]